MVDRIATNQVCHDGLECNYLVAHALLPTQDIFKQLLHQLDNMRLACARATVHQLSQGFVGIRFIIASAVEFLYHPMCDVVDNCQLLRVCRKLRIGVPANPQLSKLHTDARRRCSVYGSDAKLPFGIAGRRICRVVLLFAAHALLSVCHSLLQAR